MPACAVAIAKRYLDEYPNHAVAWLSHGISLYSIARYPEALAALRRAARLCPPEKLHIVHSHLGHLHHWRGNYHLAKNWFRKAMASSPTDASAYIYLGGLLALEGRLKEAEKTHRRATLCEQGCIEEAFLDLGFVLRAQERYPEALACFQRALEIDPKYKDAKKALIDVERVIEINRVSEALPRKSKLVVRRRSGRES
jgi:tetratricopeptide (TPR) repeat protein